MLHKLLYISRATPLAREGPDAIKSILAVSRRRNEALDVTGVLIFTQDHFAQLLEGPAPALDQLMGRIERDPRHTEVSALLRQESVSRSFKGWHMAYQGSSVFVARHIRVLTAPFVAPNALHVTRLMELMATLAGRRGDVPEPGRVGKLHPESGA